MHNLYKHIGLWLLQNTDEHQIDGNLWKEWSQCQSIKMNDMEQYGTMYVLVLAI